MVCATQWIAPLWSHRTHNERHIAAARVEYLVSLSTLSFLHQLISNVFSIDINVQIMLALIRPFCSNYSVGHAFRLLFLLTIYCTLFVVKLFLLILVNITISVIWTLFFCIRCLTPEGRKKTFCNAWILPPKPALLKLTILLLKGHQTMTKVLSSLTISF